MIERNSYLNQLLDWKDKNIIKVLTGIRRCGKSTIWIIRSCINTLKSEW